MESGEERAEAFWRTQNEAGGIARVLQRLRAGVIVCDAGFARLARAIGPADAPYALLEAATAETLDLAALQAQAAGKPVYVFCLNDYAAVTRAVAALAARTGGRMFGFAHDISPSLLCNDDPWRHADGEPAVPRSCYAIISTARSGSTFLSDLLARNGFGNAKEHIRDAFISITRNRESFGLDFTVYLDRLRRRGAVQGCFGTKIISGFYGNVDACLTDAERAVFDEMIWSGPVIYLYRRSKIEQAVSDYIARALQTWHVRDAAAQAQHTARLAALDYDFEAINQRYGICLADEMRLRQFVAKRPRVLQVDYEDLLARTAPMLRDIVRFIANAAAPENLALDSGLMRTQGDQNAAFCEKFRADVIAKKLYQDLREDVVLAELK
jgi:LPS sulfotransferase NodH